MLRSMFITLPADFCDKVPLIWELSTKSLPEAVTVLG